MPSMKNVTVQKDVQGGTTIITGADGNEDRGRISITPATTRWIPLPVFGRDYYIVDATGKHWDAVCTTAPADDQSAGFFTAK